MTTTEIRILSPGDLNKIQNAIEQCLQLHLTLNETKNTLLVKANIIPEFTEVAWKKLEEANPEFFEAYHFRLLVRDQVEKFNRLLDRQAELMVQISNTPAIHMPQSSSNMGLMQAMNGDAVNAGNMGLMQAMNGEMMNLGNMGLVQPMNGEMTNLGTGHINGSHFMFGPNGYVLDAHHAAAEIPVSSYSSVESQSQRNAAFENMGLNPSSFNLPDSFANFSLNSGSPNMGFVQPMNGEMVNAGNMGLMQAMNGEMMNLGNMGLVHPMNGEMTYLGNMGLVQPMYGEMTNLGSGHINGSHFMFGPNGYVLDAHHAAAEIPVSSYSSVESQSQPNAAFENMGLNPSSFNLPDSTANFSLNSDILESYSGSPFIASGSNNLNPQDGVEQQEGWTQMEV